MKLLQLLIVSVCLGVSLSLTHEYEESIDDLLVQCNAYQSQLESKNRTNHACEKKDPDREFSYHIMSMKAEFTKRDYLCALFFKTDYISLDFEFLFSHAQFNIDAVRKNFKRDVMQMMKQILFVVWNKVQQTTRKFV